MKGTGKVTKYFIATYSAHGTIIRNLVGSSELEYLCVNCGGFKCPQNCIDIFEEDVSMFKKSVAITKKTLHAKVVLEENDKLADLWLWTGNMRHSTLDDCNVLLTIPLDTKNKKKTKEWFENLASKKGIHSNHLIYDEKNGVSYPKQTMWESISDSIEKTLKGNKEKIKVYACSPWGSKEFVDALCGHSSLQDAEISLFTRNVPDKNFCWMDWAKDGVSCYVSKDGPFPHYKMIFITREYKGSEKIIWSYIGSANFTQSAMFSEKNIEHAAFFYDNLKQFSNLLAELQSKKIWSSRKQLKIKKNKENTNDEELSESYDIGGFEYLDVAKKLSFLYEKRNCQKVLDDCYKEELKSAKQNRNVQIWNYKYGKCKFEFFFLGDIDYAYHLRVRLVPKDPWYNIDIPRIISEALPINPSMVNQKLSLLLDIPVKWKKGSGSKKEKKNDNERSKDVKRLNLRFPIERVVNDENVIEKLKGNIAKVKIAEGSLSDEQRKKFAIWSKLIENL